MTSSCSISRSFRRARVRPVYSELTVMTAAYAGNAAHSVLLAFDQPEASCGEIYNVGDDKQFDHFMKAQIVANELGHSWEILSLPHAVARPAYPALQHHSSSHRMVDTSKIRAQLGYRDVFDPEQALRETVRWQRDHLYGKSETVVLASGSVACPEPRIREACPMRPFDWLVLGSYALAVLLIAGRVARPRNGGAQQVEDWMLAGRTLPTAAVWASMLATELSAATFIGVPHAAYLGDWSYLQFAWGALLGKFLAARTFIPLYHRLGVVTVYGFIRERFGDPAQRATAAAFVVAGAHWGTTDGQVMFIFIITLAAAEVAIALPLVVGEPSGLWRWLAATVLRLLALSPYR